LYGHSPWSHKPFECNRWWEIRKKALAQDRKIEAAWRLSDRPMGYAAQAPGLLKMNFIFKMPGWYSELAVGTRFESSADYFMSLPLLCN
jgi:hypothetical protein